MTVESDDDEDWFLCDNRTLRDSSLIKLHVFLWGGTLALYTQTHDYGWQLEKKFAYEWVSDGSMMEVRILMMMSM